MANGLDILEGLDTIEVVEKDEDMVAEEEVAQEVTEETVPEKEIETTSEEAETPDEEEKVTTKEVEEPNEKPEHVAKSKVKGSVFNGALDFVTNPINDPEWAEFKDMLTEKMNTIVIKENVAPNIILLIASELDSVYNIAYEEYMNMRTAMDNLTNKEDGILTVIKASNISGSNETERKASGIKAAQEYKIGKNKVNLFEFIAETRNRYNFLQGIMDQIKFKKDLLVIASSANKLLNK